MSRSQARQVSGETFGTRLRVARDSSGQTQEQIAQRLGVTLRTYQRWEAGDSQPNGRQLVDLAALLDVVPGSLYPAEAQA